MKRPPLSYADEWLLALYKNRYFLTLGKEVVEHPIVLYRFPSELNRDIYSITTNVNATKKTASDLRKRPQE